jgi:gliding motility-associated-like protein
MHFKFKIIRTIVILGFVLYSILVFSQCDKSYFLKIQDKYSDYTGMSIAKYSIDTIIACGSREDTMIFILLSADGTLIKSKKFKVEGTEKNHIMSLFVDKDKKIIGTGLNDNSFYFKYDILADKFVWFKYVNESILYWPRNLIQLENSNNYLLSINSEENFNDLNLSILDKNTGNVIGGFSKNYNLGAAENLVDFVEANNSFYGIGRFTNGGSFGDMRTSLVKFDKPGGTLIWAKVLHLPRYISARLYGFDMDTDGKFLYLASYGNENGDNLQNNAIFFYKLDFNGNIVSLIKYDILDTNSELGFSLVKVKDGFIIYAFNNSNKNELYFISIDQEGKLKWARKLKLNNVVSNQTLYNVTNRALAIGDYFYFTSNVYDGRRTNVVLARIRTDGTTECGGLEPLQLYISSVLNPTVTNVSLVEYKEALSLPSRNVQVSKYIPSIMKESCFDSLSLDLGPDVNLNCNKESIDINVKVVFEDYDWSNGDTSSNITISDTGLYILNTIDKCGVVYSDSIYVGRVTPTLHISMHDTMIINPQSIHIDPLISGNWETINWFDQNGNQISTEKELNTFIDQNTFYYAVITDSYGCTDVDTIRITMEIRDCPPDSYFIPNVFTPNHDGINDFFTVFGPNGCLIRIKRLLIYDRWGENVFEGINLVPGDKLSGWDGRLKGKQLDPAVFAYWAELEFYNNQTKIIKGNVTLLR